MGSQANVVVESKDKAKEMLITAAAARVGGMAYAFATDDGGKITVHERWSQPCYGEMRPYGSTHKDVQPKRQATVHKPGDLHTPFPQTGNPIMVALSLYGTNDLPKDQYPILEDFLRAYIDPETSPWRDATKYASIVSKEGRPVGILYESADYNPTVLVEGWMFMRGRLTKAGIKIWGELRKALPEAPTNELLLTWFFCHTYDGVSFYFGSGDYYLSSYLEPSRFLEGRPITEGPTFHDRGAYDRPTLHDLFGHTKTNILASVKSFFPKTTNITVTDLPEVYGAFKKAFAVTAA